MRMPSCCVPVAEAALFVPVRSSARFFAASAQHGFKTRALAAEACNLICCVLARKDDVAELAACKTLASKARLAKASRTARSRHLPPAGTIPGVLPGNASGEAPLLRIIGTSIFQAI